MSRCRDLHQLFNGKRKALQVHKILNSSQKYRKFIHEFVSFLTRVRELYRITYYTAIDENDVFLGATCFQCI